jgi:cell surface protein SprA
LFNFNRLLIFCGAFVFFVSGFYQAVSDKSIWDTYFELYQEDTIKTDTTKKDSLVNQPYRSSRTPTFRPRDRVGDPFTHQQSPSPLMLRDPSTLKLDVDIDTSMNYTIYEKMGDINYRPTSTMTYEEFSKLQEQNMIRNYWRTRSLGLDGESPTHGRKLIPPIHISPLFDRIFGGSYVDITPNGFVNLDFGGRWQRLDNPAIPVRQQRNGGFEFDQQISMNVTGKIGEKLSVLANFDNNNSFEFENDLKVEYTGFDEEIIKKIEFGNVSLPINNSLITGAQSLFGIKTQLQFGRLYVTSVASTQRGQSDVIEIESGVQGRQFEIRASDYDENRHFFLGHFFRDHYGNEPGQWLHMLPYIQSGVNIANVEVYLINRNNNTENLRNVLALMDLGEGDPRNIFNNQIQSKTGQNAPNTNTANDLFERISNNPAIRDIDKVDGLLRGLGMEQGRDYEKIPSARKLNPTEYTYNPALGFISLSRRLQSDEALAVSYSYTYNGQTYKVGELSNDYSSLPEKDMIVLKMLRPSKVNSRVPTWNLMMKNIYNLNAMQINPDGFEMRIIYRDDNTGINNPSLHEGINTKDIPLIQIMGLDQLNSSQVRQRDGNFDFVEGITVNSATGHIIFPVKEPFGSHLRKQFNQQQEMHLINKYVYDTLYRTTKADAELETSKNKFYLSGRFQSGSAREIMLPGINISENSVRVMAGNTPLLEGLDYRVDYHMGKVTLLNEGVLNSGKRITIHYEKADLFNFQTRTLLGNRFDYRVSDDFNIGGTMLYVNERAINSRPVIGSEPSKNFQYGFDLNYRAESRFLTKLVDALPFISTKEISTVSFNVEFAQLMPGTSNKVRGDGTSYIDDFENALNPISLNDIPSWKLAATPKTADNRFFGENEDLTNGYRRAKMAWYIVDNVFYRRGGSLLPPNITDRDKYNLNVAPFMPQDLWNKSQEEIPSYERIFDVAFFPRERGQYNYNPDLEFRNGKALLKNPQSNWGGISRAISSDVETI